MSKIYASHKKNYDLIEKVSYSCYFLTIQIQPLDCRRVGWYNPENFNSFCSFQRLLNRNIKNWNINV